MLNVVSPTAGSTRPRFALVVLAVGLIVANIYAATSFVRQAESARVTEIDLAVLARDAASMQALEWQAVAERAVSPELSEAFAQVAESARQSLLRIEVGRGADPRLAAIDSLYLAYRRLITTELRLIDDGQMSEALAIDRRSVDPAYAALEAAIAGTAAAYAERSRTIIRNRTWAAAAIIVLGALAMLALSWAYGKAKLSVERIRLEDAALRRTATALRAEVDQRREAQEAVRRLHHRTEMILDASSDGILGLDAEGRHTFVNRAASEQLGYEPSELIGQPAHDVWHHSRIDGTVYPISECPIAATFRGGAAHRLDNEVFWRKDGTSFPVAYASSPVWDGDALVGAVVTFRDVTREREDAAMREHLLGSLQSALASVDTMTGQIPVCSHCKRIRDDDGSWSSAEVFMAARTSASFSHGVCPECLAAHHPQGASSER